MSLSKRQSKALESSIKHWERLEKCKTIEDFKKEDWSGEQCACCKIYDTESGCSDSCPVKMKTGWGNCDGTPWGDASVKLWDYVNGETEELPIEAIRKELNFLRSLRKL